MPPHPGSVRFLTVVGVIYFAEDAKIFFFGTILLIPLRAAHYSRLILTDGS